ncbi:MAG TPA: YceI family protein [Vicinamibacterales bacterium]|jgi:polyisoprenoid-binding protein YceI|nr:YceI family protein [Vicinamibacterales bacterium]
MKHPKSSLAALAAVLTLGLHAAATAGAASPASVSLSSARVSIAGTSNIHPYTASTNDVRVVRVQIATTVAGGDWADVLTPGAIGAFELSIPAATLSSPREGIDKTMHKALKVAEFPEITFRLSRLEAAAAPAAYRGVGMLRIAGVEREVTLELKTRRNESTLTVRGETQLLMTDYGITPPKAMLGMLKTDPRITVTFETELTMAAAPVSTN